MNERELADAERMLNDARVRSKPKITLARAGMTFFGFVVGAIIMTALLGVTGAILATLGGGLVLFNALSRVNVAPAHDLRLQPEGIANVTRPEAVTLLPYANIDAVARVGDAVAVRVGKRTLDIECANSGFVSVLHRYVEARVRAAHALADERRVATDYLVRVDASPDYRHAGPPTSALEAIARAKGMPIELRVDAARAIELSEDEIGVTEELKQSKTMFEP
jgi:hypothetical protein